GMNGLRDRRPTTLNEAAKLADEQYDSRLHELSKYRPAARAKIKENYRTTSGLLCQRGPPGTQDHPVTTHQIVPGPHVIGVSDAGILWPAVH
ncbi:Hypothetical predicted protein, partial [Pelobates cultripes]